MDMSVYPVDARPVVIVDAFGRGSVLAEAFAEHAPCIHVSSRASMPDMFLRSLRRDLFVKDYNAPVMGMAALCERLERHRPAAVLAGNEFGVELADLLSERLGLASNGSALSAARRNKYEMSAAVRSAGISVAAQLSTGSHEEATEWFDRQRVPVVVKPLNSAGSDDVFICHSKEAVSAACRAVLGTTNLMLSTNDAVLVQEYLEGPEFIVNCVSQASRHWVTDVWACTKRVVAGGDRKIYDRQDLLDGHSHTTQILAEYTHSVLDALGIAFGPTHTEIILTAEGPKLLETGARITGQILPRGFKAAGDRDQIEMTVMCYLQPSRMEAFQTLYTKKANACIVEAIVQQETVLRHTQLEAYYAGVPSFSHLRFRVDDGSILRPTTDLSSAPASYFLLHESADQVEEDYVQFRKVEQALYQSS